jgi:mono/diheme cytochrome c family protein
MLAIGIAACGPSKPMTPAQQGRIVYMTNCVVCHNPDPNLAGSQGPPIAGSSRELVNDRVLNLKYPPGYTPKRTTHAMRALPQLANQIDNLTAFLAEAANPKK